LVAVLGRALTESDRDPYVHADYGIAIGATALAVAAPEELEHQRQAGALTDRMETHALRVASQLGAGSDGWLQIIRRLAAGTADDRARAAQLIKDSWHHPAWTQIVADLIDAGLDGQSLAAWRGGLTPDSTGADFDDQLFSRTEMLQPLVDDPRSTVRSFATEAAQYLDTFRDY
jgi:hypothetical protein